MQLLRDMSSYTVSLTQKKERVGKKEDYQSDLRVLHLYGNHVQFGNETGTSRNSLNSIHLKPAACKQCWKSVWHPESKAGELEGQHRVTLPGNFDVSTRGQPGTSHTVSCTAHDIKAATFPLWCRSTCGQRALQ